MPRRDCGPHRVEWHARSCFCRTTHQTFVSLYDVTLSSRSTTPGGPVRDRTHRTIHVLFEAELQNSRNTQTVGRFGVLTMGFSSHPANSSTPSSSKRVLYRRGTCATIRFTRKAQYVLPNLEGSFLPELSYPWQPNARARTTGTDPRLLKQCGQPKQSVVKVTPSSKNTSS
ncbi:hypothetical protein TNCT_367731 [Trichonephila clavata]|uniref:Uncharacterized protein n=1 Tax=Trichonephila clavata TaxID=2740835 RepID=A0A8X6LKQ2_TRICU|nr:hypothetical protein TNCT_367731 [Trichonephila clavata]